jgi:hypothetical protein
VCVYNVKKASCTAGIVRVALPSFPIIARPAAKKPASSSTSAAPIFRPDHSSFGEHSAGMQKSHTHHLIRKTLIYDAYRATCRSFMEGVRFSRSAQEGTRSVTFVLDFGFFAICHIIFRYFSDKDPHSTVKIFYFLIFCIP